MIFIAILAALLTERFFHWRYLRSWHWFAYYQHRVAEMWSGRLSPLQSFLMTFCMIFFPLVLTGLIQFLLAGRFHYLPSLIFDIFILLYCMGPDNLWAGFADAPSSPARTFFLAANQRVFAVIFWFCLLGPSGAVLYRIIAQVEEGIQPVSEICRKIKTWLDWLPVRLLTFLFALVGHFTVTFACWKQYVWQPATENESLLADCGMAALDLQNQPADTELQEAIALFDRTLLAGMVVLSLFVFV